MSEFIFMLTREDATVPDAVESYTAVRDLDLRWVGFKDVGVGVGVLRELADRIRADGRKVALEVVSLDVESELRSAEVALDIGVNLLMGGTHPEAVLPLLRESNVLYYPFAGTVVSHPSILRGPVEEIVASASEFSALPGVHGLDLLAYRYEGDVPRLMASVVRAASVPVVVAGSIDTDDKIRSVSDSGAWAFTVGSAAFDGAFPAPPSLRDQLIHVIDVLNLDDDNALETKEPTAHV
jgi:4-hydroxythreonine-4-phosphate dehydrogenase